MDDLNLCESVGFLQALNVIKNIFTIIKYLVPLILIIRLTFDVYGLVQDPKNNKKVFNAVKNRLIAALLVFFIPTILNMILTSMSNANVVSECYNNAAPEFIQSIKASHKTIDQNNPY